MNTSIFFLYLPCDKKVNRSLAARLIRERQGFTTVNQKGDQMVVSAALTFPTYLHLNHKIPLVRMFDNASTIFSCNDRGQTCLSFLLLLLINYANQQLKFQLIGFSARKIFHLVVGEEEEKK